MTRWLVVGLVLFAGCGGSARIVVGADYRDPLYIDGVQQRVAIRTGADDELEHDVELGAGTTLRVAPGVYTVVSYTGFCRDSVCTGKPERRAFFCQARVRVETRTELVVRTRAREPCEIVTR